MPIPKSAKSDYTKEQKDLVGNICQCKDFYKILNVDKKASPDEIRIAFRKRIREVHPDKCKHPSATEASKGELKNI